LKSSGTLSSSDLASPGTGSAWYEGGGWLKPASSKLSRCGTSWYFAVAAIVSNQYSRMNEIVGVSCVVMCSAVTQEEGEVGRSGNNEA